MPPLIDCRAINCPVADSTCKACVRGGSGYAKNVPSRKTDVSDVSWLRRLHFYGLLRGSFRPTAKIATLRAYRRQRERLVEYAAAHIH
jgi:hypothetical protein